MRKSFPPEVESGRIQRHPYVSPPGETYGAFFVKHPRSGNLFRFLVSDGIDWEKCGFAPPAWEHVSLSLVAGDRLPTWSEMCWAKGLFWEPEECVIQFHPPESEYVNRHEGTLHLWRLIGSEFPRPPRGTVG